MRVVTTTCSRCLSGNHRCLTTGCACSCRGVVRRPRVAAGGVLRSPRPSRAAWSTAPDPATGPTPAKVLALVEMLRRYQLTGELA